MPDIRKLLSILLALAAMASSSAALAADDDWHRIAKLEVAFQVLNAADFATTKYCMDRATCHEANPLLGSHPSTNKLFAVKAASGIVHFVVARWLTDRDPHAARIFEIASIAIQGGVVGANLRFAF